MAACHSGAVWTDGAVLFLAGAAASLDLPKARRAVDSLRWESGRRPYRTAGSRGPGDQRTRAASRTCLVKLRSRGFEWQRTKSKLKPTAGYSFFENGRKWVEAYGTETCLIECFSRPETRMGLPESHLKPPGNQNEKTRIFKNNR